MGCFFLFPEKPIVPFVYSHAVLPRFALFIAASLLIHSQKSYFFFVRSVTVGFGWESDKDFGAGVNLHCL